MKRFVSQKTRLIPNLREAGARKHLRAHRSTNDFQNHTARAGGRVPRQSQPLRKTILHTKSVVLRSQWAFLPGSDEFFPLHERDDKRHLCERASDGRTPFRSAFCTLLDWRDDWRRSAARRGRKRPAAADQPESLLRRDLRSLRPQSLIS